MNEIQQTKEDIAILQEKLEKLEELEELNSFTLAERAYKKRYGHKPYPCGKWRSFELAYNVGYNDGMEHNKNFEPTPQTPEQVEQGLRDAMKQAKEDGVFDEPKPETLYEALTNIEYIGCCYDDILDAVRCWLPKEQSAKGSQNVYVECTVDGFNDCLKKIKSKLK